jgi:hypothetical protein
MAFDARTGQTIYRTDDLLGLARLGAFGPKSDVLLTALMHLKFYEENYPKLQKETETLREAININGSVEEIVVEEKKPKAKK